MVKKPKGKRKPSVLYKLYDKGKLNAMFCPKCGQGVHMAAHKSRKTCGKCGYTEFTRKS